MKSKFLNKYFSIIFVIATFIGVLHHHNDLKQHNNCQICNIQSNIANADTPVVAIYFTKLSFVSEAILAQLQTLISPTIQDNYNSRAPPKLS